jgi:hypothetical protein
VNKAVILSITATGAYIFALKDDHLHERVQSFGIKVAAHQQIRQEKRGTKNS